MFVEVYNKLTKELMDEYGVIKLDDDYYAIKFMEVNAKEHDYDSDIVPIDSRVSRLNVKDGDTLIAIPLRNGREVEIWNSNDTRHGVLIKGYMGSDDSTYYFLNSLSRWFLENKNIGVNALSYLYYDEKGILTHINRLQDVNL